MGGTQGEEVQTGGNISIHIADTLLGRAETNKTFYSNYTPIKIFLKVIQYVTRSGSEGKEPAFNAGDQGSIPVSGRSPGEGNGTPLQYSCLENPMDRGAWRSIVHGRTEQLTLLVKTKVTEIILRTQS